VIREHGERHANHEADSADSDSHARQAAVPAADRSRQQRKQERERDDSAGPIGNGKQAGEDRQRR
jgi:hypothetical protein